VLLLLLLLACLLLVREGWFAGEENIAVPRPLLSARAPVAVAREVDT